MSREPESFSEQVASMLRRLCPDRRIELTGMLELRINGRHLDLQNLYRMVQQNPDRAVETVEDYLDHLIEGEAASSMPLPLELARPRIMPRIQPESIFERLDRESVVYEPFVNGTVVLYVIDMPHLTVSITVEQMLKWGITLEEIDALARTNLEEYAPDLKIRFVETEEGGRAAIFAQGDGYDASRLLLGRLHDRLAPALGGNFYVATPARDAFVAISQAPEDFADRLHPKVERDYRRLPYPITDQYFLVTLDGIAGTAA